mgnify:CR=1 FL=1
MTTTPTEKPEAIWLADALDELDAQFTHRGMCGEAAAELRRQHAEIARLTDAYCGAREDLAIWKRRALEAEEKLRAESAATSRLVSELNAENGPTHMGEPAQQRKPLSYRQIAEATTKFVDVWSDKVIGIARAIEAAHGIGEKT